MQVTIDIPDALYHELESRTHGNPSLDTIVVEAAERAMAQAALTEMGAAASRHSLAQMDLNLNDFMLMSDDDMELFDRIAGFDPEAALQVFGIRRLENAA